ncbi:MAG: ankyrin repeat domain-containing protein [Actinomycetota bacterium]
MTRKRGWEIGSAVVLAAVVALASGGYYQWWERQRRLNQELSNALDFAALHKGKSKAARVLEALQNGGDPQVVGKSGFTCLQAICLLGDERRVSRLLEQGAAVNARDHLGYTPLMMAVSSGNPVTVQLLVKHGANVNAQANNGSTALRRAGSDQRLVSILKAAGAVDAGNQNIRWRFTRTPPAKAAADQNGNHPKR